VVPVITLALINGVFLGLAVAAYLRARVQRKYADRAYARARDLAEQLRSTTQAVLRLPICEHCHLLYVQTGPDQYDHPYCPSNYVTV
jgi:threonine aldolase